MNDSCWLADWGDVRTFIQSSLSVEEFFERLNGFASEYVVLRWFDDLPHVDRGEDIDILVSQESLDNLLSLTDKTNRRGVPLDIYTPNGLRNTGWGKSLVFPPECSESILQHRTRGQNGVWKPGGLDYFYSMAYHVVFHKGSVSGIPENLGDEAEPADHDYLNLLRIVGGELLAPPPELSLNNLYTFLKSQQWYPTPDMMDMYSRRNFWLAKRWAQEIHALAEPWTGLSLFFLREKGSEFLSDFRELVELMGFKVLKQVDLDAAQVRWLSSHVRGGDWGRGPYPQSGGLPDKLLVCFDAFPQRVPERQKVLTPSLGNYRELQTKKLLRKKFIASVAKRNRANVVHSSDNGLMAEYVCRGIFSDSEMADVVSSATDFKNSMALPFEPTRLFETGRKRSVVFETLIDGKIFVVKWFKPGCERFLQRELWVRQQLISFPSVQQAKLIGETWFALEKVRGATLEGSTATPREVREILQFVRRLRGAGVEAIDFFPKNVLRLSSNELMFMDFEYFQPVSPRTSIRGSLAFWDPSPASNFELPLDSHTDLYRKRWEKVLAIPRWMTRFDFSENSLRVAQFVFKRFLPLRVSVLRLGRRYFMMALESYTVYRRRLLRARRALGLALNKAGMPLKEAGQ